MSSLLAGLTPPHLRHRIQCKDGIRVLQMPARLGKCRVEPVVGNQAQPRDRAAQRFNGRRQVIDHRIGRAHADQHRPEVNIQQAGALCELIKALGEMHIAADTREPAGRENPLRQVIVNTHSPAVVSQVRGLKELVTVRYVVQKVVGLREPRQPWPRRPP